MVPDFGLIFWDIGYSHLLATIQSSNHVFWNLDVVPVGGEGCCFFMLTDVVMLSYKGVSFESASSSPNTPKTTQEDLICWRCYQSREIVQICSVLSEESDWELSNTPSLREKVFFDLFVGHPKAHTVASMRINLLDPSSFGLQNLATWNALQSHFFATRNNYRLQICRSKSCKRPVFRCPLLVSIASFYGGLDPAISKIGVFSDAYLATLACKWGFVTAQKALMWSLSWHDFVVTLFWPMIAGLLLVAL